MDAFGLGALAAVACRHQFIWEWLRRHKAVLYVAFALLSLRFAWLIHRPDGLFVFGIAWIAALYVVLLLLAVVDPERPLGALLRWPVLSALGGISYGVYLMHQGVHGMVHVALFGKMPAVTSVPEIGATLLSAGLVLLLASCSWKWLEGPLVRRGHRRCRYEFTAERADGRPSWQAA
jgi:peptidoglycan/LPS O-acetylase OafA/YrhL